VLNLAYGALLGFPIIVTRAKGAAVAPKYLMSAHLSTLLHAAVLFGLVWAAEMSALGANWDETAAWLVVIASALIAAKDTVLWLTGVKDEFREKVMTMPLAGIAAVGEPFGIGIFVVGVLKGL
jgi:hypothetical protein